MAIRDFGFALEKMRRHVKVRRLAWAEGKTLAIVDGVFVLTSDSKSHPWSPSQKDLLATDWRVA